MKGIAHFASAVAVASFLPQVIERSAQGSLVLLLAGMGGLMPDTLDFRVARFLRKPDLEIDAESCGAASEGLDAQVVAERLAALIERVHQTGVPAFVRLGTIRLGTDLWQRYRVRFKERRVHVRVGPSVDGVRAPMTAAEREGSAAVAVPLEQARSFRGEAAVVVDVFSGTALEFRPQQGGIEIVFLPWHRQWSHSLILTAVLGAAIALLAGPLAGLVYVLGSLTHILEDQLGYMGSNLLYPFTQRRINGLGFFHSGDAVPNLLAVWLGAVLLLMNVDRFSSAPLFAPWRWLLAGFVIPWTLIGVLWGWVWHRRHRGWKAGGVSNRKSSLGPLTLVDVSQDGERVLLDRASMEGEPGDG